ncbi:MAG TPA: hypothetical protein PLM29_10405, partial [Deltaproteobacteria bacterium]|nr:hypothetical protein [Deltaproteobacteria bacterium]
KDALDLHYQLLLIGKHILSLFSIGLLVITFNIFLLESFFWGRFPLADPCCISPENTGDTHEEKFA